LKRDLTAGASVMLFGLIYAAYTAYSLPLGTLRRMGSGMFPLGLGLLLALMGLAIALPALARDVPRPAIPIRSLGLTLLAIAAFALLIRPFGLLPAVMATTIIASFGLPGPRPRAMAASAIGLSVLTWALFVVLLQLPIPVLAWPF
jgi:hypothetical protein